MVLKFQSLIFFYFVYCHFVKGQNSMVKGNNRLIDLCNIEPRDKEGRDITETRNTVVFIWNLIMD